MAENILYFPYIHLPDNKWLYRSLLYWDQIGTITPVEFEIPESSLTNRLFDLNLAVPVHPEDVIYQSEKYVTSFIELVDDEDYPVKPGALVNGAGATKIHISKMVDIAEKLEERGLAKMEYWPWCDVESYTAAKFMAYLAGVVGGKKGMVPASDNIENLSSFISQTPEELHLKKKISQDRIQELDDILPVPSTLPDLKGLADFKQKHRDELLRFRSHIEHFTLDLQSFPSQAAKDLKIQQFKKDFAEEVTRIERMLEASKVSKLGLGSFLSLSSASFGMAASVMATGAGSLIGAVAAALGLAGAGYSTFKQLKDSKAEVKQSFAAYAIAYKQ